TMARLWQVPQILLAILVSLMALTYQEKRKTFLSVKEVPASECYVAATMQYVINDFNEKSDDKYSFQTVHVLKVQKQITGHVLYHVNMEMRQTTCQKFETTNCSFQEGEIYKQIECFHSVFVPWFEKYRILNKNCTNG
uniref:Cystatin 11 n=2 Tax=Mustela putorius furo TaxID=9669 RepID=M3XPZ3_MUSPF